MILYRCHLCQWWDNQHISLKDMQIDYGYCRKHHPVVYLRESRYYGSWPLVHKDDFCGEFREDQQK